MRTEHIKALTGIRFFAALWVVLYHSTRHNSGVLDRNFPNAIDLVRPVIGMGLRGVDLFFILSGFVLALNYLDQLGPRWDLAKAGRFLWMRLARVWPLFITVTILTMGTMLLRHIWWGSVGVGKLTASRFWEQLLMVQLWNDPVTGGSSVPGPAWSLSAEWLAYLLFPLLALVVLRLHHLMRARALFIASAVALVPLMIQLLAFHNFTGSYGWTLRILCEFTAGMLLCAAISRLDLTDRQRTIAGVGGLVVIAVLVALLYFSYFHGPRWTASFGVFLFLPLIGCLAAGTGPLRKVLSTRVMVLGGGLSYALYLVHSPMLYLFRDVLRKSGWFEVTPLTEFYLELAYIPVIVVTAWALFRYVEEPSRRMMRSMLAHDFPRADHALVPERGRTHPADTSTSASPPAGTESTSGSSVSL